MSDQTHAALVKLGSAAVIVFSSVASSIVAASMWVGGYAERVVQVEKRVEKQEELLRRIADDVAFVRGRIESK
jgi:hypothetical protein